MAINSNIYYADIVLNDTYTATQNYSDSKHISTFNPVIATVVVTHPATTNFNYWIECSVTIKKSNYNSNIHKDSVTITTNIEKYRDVSTTISEFNIYLSDIIRSNAAKSNINDYNIDERTVTFDPEMLHTCTIVLKKYIDKNTYVAVDEYKTTTLYLHNLVRQFSQDPYINPELELNKDDLYIGASNLPVYLYCWNNSEATNIIISRNKILYVLDNDDVVFTDNDNVKYIY